MCASGPHPSEFFLIRDVNQSTRSASNGLACKEAKMRSQRIELGASLINSSGKSESELSRQSAINFATMDLTA